MKLRKPAKSYRDPCERLLPQRIPFDDVKLGRAYVIHARNGGVGVAVETDGLFAYRLHREKHGPHYPFDEYDWEHGPPHGTAFALRELPDDPPTDDAELLNWLAAKEAEHRAEIDAAWEVILGPGWRDD